MSHCGGFGKGFDGIIAIIIIGLVLYWIFGGFSRKRYY
ncbi:hypothetical protein FTV88_0895 [Heliorestis convoluta]|uniref:Uncharacterized protein n=1 Tax=Heliorestis convoluta TaxID=356322 RepID=A0A5Q2MYK8_9FIRM|nr:hypothetical protein FTV88_0895 [Heliorestis convoluta]